MSYRFLVADDTEVVRELIATALSERYGAEIDQAADGKELERMAQLAADNEQPYDSIFSDNDMPEKRGLQVIPLLRSQQAYAKTPIFLMSGNIIGEKAWRGAGASDFLAKPFGMDDLAEKVDKYFTARPR